MADNRFDNRARAIRRMRAIPDAVREAVKERNLDNAADLAGKIANVVPVDEGDLRDSIEFRDKTRPGRISAVVTAGEGGQEAKARAVEFGRPDMEAQPFFFPVFRANRKRYARRLSLAASKAIKLLMGRA